MNAAMWPRYSMPVPADVAAALAEKAYCDVAAKPSEDFLDAIIEEAEAKHSAQEVHFATFTTLKTEIDRIRPMDSEEILGCWMQRALLLTKSEAKEYVDEVSRLTGRGKRQLTAELKEFRQEAERQQAQQRALRSVRGRMLAEYQPAALTDHAREIEEAIVNNAVPGEYVAFGGTLSRVAYQQLPFTHEIDDEEGDAPAVPQIEPMNDVDVLEKAEKVYALVNVNARGIQIPIAIPERIISIILKKSDHKAPRIAGLATHPLVLPNGEIVAERGLHKSGLFLACDAIDGLRPYSQAESAVALSRLRSDFLDGFEFDDEIDAVVALAGLFTGIQRRLMDMAPGLAILAAAQSSGKTTLARRIHVLLTGCDMPATSFPQNDEAEVGKQLHALLLRNPAMICFDNITDGLTFRSGAISSAMTGAVWGKRILGVTRNESCPTNVLFCFTGNNISLGADEVSRWMTTRLAPKTARPESRSFRHPDVVAHAMKMREKVLRDVVGIVAGYLSSGTRIAPRTRFVQWDSMVRQPLLWAGAMDVAQVFERNTKNAEHVLALESLIFNLSDLFGENKFTAQQVAAATVGTDGMDVHGNLRVALECLRARDPTSPRSVGHVLAANAKKYVVIDGVDYWIEQIVDRPNVLYSVKPQAVPKPQEES